MDHIDVVAQMFVLSVSDLVDVRVAVRRFEHQIVHVEVHAVSRVMSQSVKIR